MWNEKVLNPQKGEIHNLEVLGPPLGGFQKNGHFDVTPHELAS
jgi:hypothetical protein